MKWKVGQEVYVVINHGGRSGYDAVDTISKIGRRWAYLSGLSRYRFDPATSRIDGGNFSSPGMVWPSKQAHDDSVERARAWSALRMGLRDTARAPAHLTTEQIKRIHAEIVGETE